VIANLENNRRDTVSVAEVLILAAALDVPPIMLITAVGQDDSVEILPNLEISTWKARGWILGAVPPPQRSFSLANWQEARRAIALYDIHRLLVKEHQQIQARISRLAEQDPFGAGNAEELASSSRRRQIALTDAVSELAYSIDRLRTHRNLIKAEGFLLPEISPTLSSALRESESTGRHASDRDVENGDTSSTRAVLHSDDLLPPLLYEQMRLRLSRHEDERKEDNN
jgi:hypothetical protein